MAKVVAIPQNRKVLTERMMKGYVAIFDMVPRHLEYQKREEDRLLAKLAQGWVVAPGPLKLEFGERREIVSRIRVVKRKPKVG